MVCPEFSLRSRCPCTPKICSSLPWTLIGELLLGKLSETVVVHSNAPHNRPGGFMCHLIGNRASFLCTEAPMRRIQNEVSGHQLTSTSVPLAEEGPQPLLAGASQSRFDFSSI